MATSTRVSLLRLIGQEGGDRGGGIVDANLEDRGGGKGAEGGGMCDFVGLDGDGDGDGIEWSGFSDWGMDGLVFRILLFRRSTHRRFFFLFLFLFLFLSHSTLFSSTPLPSFPFHPPSTPPPVPPHFPLPIHHPPPQPSHSPLLQTFPLEMHTVILCSHSSTMGLATWYIKILGAVSRPFLFSSGEKYSRCPTLTLTFLLSPLPRPPSASLPPSTSSLLPPP